MRRILALLVAAVIALLWGAVVAEYPFTGLVVLLLGALFGFFLAEAVVAVSGEQSAFTFAVCPVVAAVGLLWAAWLSNSHGLRGMSGQGWLAVALGVVAAAVRARPLGSERHTEGS